MREETTITQQPLVRSAFADACAPDPVGDLARGLSGAPAAELVVLFVSPRANAAAVIARAAQVFAPASVIGCTTAGEIGPQGYAEGQIVALMLPKAHFRARITRIDALETVGTGTGLIDRVLRTRTALLRDHPHWPHEFAFLMVDGMSTQEDRLAAHLSAGIGTVPLFGGSAGDGDDFGRTFVLHDGQTHTNAAVLVQLRTDCPVHVFCSDHMIPTAQRMVVTRADPARRIVHEINGAPAAPEYARILGKDPTQLTTFTFAAHPVVVRIGDHHHVRSIRQVLENGDLAFFSAVDEGVVLSLAEAKDMVSHLQEEMAALHDNNAPDAILACDCVLRRKEAEQRQVVGQLSDVLADNNVVGFSTYGEQVGGMHVNQTLTGVAIYPPDRRP
nr:FIST N-terminal domain-containing protein [Actibacterium mucosum]